MGIRSTNTADDDGYQHSSLIGAMPWSQQSIADMIPHAVHILLYCWGYGCV